MISTGETVVDLRDILHCTSNSFKVLHAGIYSDIAYIMLSWHGNDRRYVKSQYMYIIKTYNKIQCLS